jgi:hypothetical protein
MDGFKDVWEMDGEDGGLRQLTDGKWTGRATYLQIEAR